MRRIVPLLLALWLGGCALGAQGPTLVEQPDLVPPVPAGKGRIYFYRDSAGFGNGIQPVIRLNGAPIGPAIPRGLRYRDVEPGVHLVNLEPAGSLAGYQTTGVQRLEIGAGETWYIKVMIAQAMPNYYAPYLVFAPRVVEPVRGAPDIQTMVPLPPP